jgi:ferredoxin
MKIMIDEEACIGCGACEAICPDVFYMDGDKAKVKNDANFKDFKTEIEDARTGCPVECITVE